MKPGKKASRRLSRRIVAWEATIADLSRNGKKSGDPRLAFKRPGSQKK